MAEIGGCCTSVERDDVSAQSHESRFRPGDTEADHPRAPGSERFRHENAHRESSAEPAETAEQDGADRTLIGRDATSPLAFFEIHGKPLRTLGDYEIVGRLGGGGMGSVYKVVHRRMARTAALKVLSAELASSYEAIERFHREIRVIAALNHPNIVAAYDAREDDGIHYLVMEFVDGQDLGAIVKRGTSIPIESAIEYILQAALGLEHAHQQGIVHRDIKPSNLIVSKDGIVKVADLGIARRNTLAAQGAATTAEDGLTGTGIVMGTADYMAPEQADRPGEVDLRADIYSLGCCLYYVVTGEAMYAAGSALAKLVAHRTHPPPAMRARRPDVPPSLELVYLAMVAKNPDDRLQCMTAVVEELRKAKSQERPLAAAAALSPALPLATPAQPTPAGSPSPPAPFPAPSSAPSGESASSKPSSPAAPTRQPAVMQPMRRQPRKSDAAPLDAPSDRSSRRRMRIVPIIGILALAGAAGSIALLLNRQKMMPLILDVEPMDIELQVRVDDMPVATVRSSDGILETQAPCGERTVKIDAIGFEPFVMDATLDRQYGGRVKARLEPQRTPAGPPIDVLRQLDPEASSRRGRWVLQGRVLVSPIDSMARLELPIVPAHEYDLVLAAERRESAGEGLVVELPFAGQYMTAVVDGWSNGDLSGIVAGDTSMHKGSLLRLGKPIELAFRVRHSGIRLFSEGKFISEWRSKAASSATTAETAADQAPAKPVVLGSSSCPVVFHRIELVQYAPAVTE